MLKELRATASATRVSQARSPPTPRAALGREDLEPEQAQILKVLAAAVNRGAESVPLEALPVEAHIKRAPFTHHIDHLHKWQFVYIDRYSDGNAEVRLLPKGSKWLSDRNAMPD
jgi:RIO-like serine/threonine protein kinase